MFPITKDIIEIKYQRDLEIQSIIKGTSEKMLLLIGPCSADNEDAVCEYVQKLSILQDKVKDKIVIIPRIYTSKPRTTGEGYKGMLHNPDPKKAADIVNGLKAARKLHVRVIKESNLTCADELIYPEVYCYFDGLLSYAAIGARSVEDQLHRLIASGLNIPVGMKNPTSGNFSVMLNGINAAQLPHTFLLDGYEVKSNGNLLAHAVVRGGIDNNGITHPNYHYEDLCNLAQAYIKRNLKYPAMIIDVSHDNSMKKYYEQPRILHEVMNSRQYSKELKTMVKGFMIESYILEGSQSTEGKEYGKSITDGCLGWTETEKLVLDLADLA